VISFWVDEAHDFGIRRYLEGRGEAISGRFAVRCYERLAETVDVPGGPQVFSSLDQLTPAGRSVVGEICEQLASLQPGIPRLNDPRRCLLRPALLGVLADKGTNRFRAYAAGDADQVTKFPVFVRQAHQHEGSLTNLLESPAALRRALISLRIRGYRRADLLIVEFRDTSDREGIFRKYAAFKVGNTIVPAHVVAGRQWDLKAENSERTVEFAHEELRYIEENPHAKWLQEVFEQAGVGYGRIDYGVTREGPEAWEINLNPSLGRVAAQPRRPMTPDVAELWNQAREMSHSRVRQAFVALDREDAPGTIRLRLEPALLARAARESTKRRRRGAALALLRRLYWSSVGAPVRPLVAKIFPRP